MKPTPPRMTIFLDDGSPNDIEIPATKGTRHMATDPAILTHAQQLADTEAAELIKARAAADDVMVIAQGILNALLVEAKAQEELDAAKADVKKWYEKMRNVGRKSRKVKP